MEALIHSQIELYGRIGNSFENLKKCGSANITLGLVDARLQALERNWSKFESQHDILLASHWEALVNFDYRKQNMQSVVEECYLLQKGLYLDALRSLQNRNPTSNSGAVSEAPRPSRTTLPRIQLPQFSGCYEEWPSFRDLFHSIVGKDSSTTPVEKLHYLKSCLKGEAELLIRSLPTTEENYDRAWKALSDFFENKRLLVRTYISKFTALQKLKGESASDLRSLYHRVLSTVGALESIGRPIISGEDLFVHLIVELLDLRSRREWESSISETTEPPSYTSLQRFLDRRLQTLESLQPVKIDGNSIKTNANSARQTRALHARKKDSKSGRCSLCQGEHYIMLCDTYRGKTAEEKRKHVESNNLCFNCLGRHKLSECSSEKTCTICQKRHHSSLHDAYSSTIAKTSHLSHHSQDTPVKVLLATARVRVTDRFGILHTARALIDQGSEASLVTESLAQRLKLPRSSASVAVYGVGGLQTGVSRGLVTFNISALKGGPQMSVSALVFPKLTIYDSAFKVENKLWPHITGLELADPDFLATDSVEILLGADVFATILQDGLRKNGSLQPMAQKTSLGWILSGPVKTLSTSLRTSTSANVLRIGDEDLTDIVRRFWQQEEFPVAAVPLSPDDQECEDLFRRTHSRTTEGRYVVRLPIIEPLPDFSSTRSSALRVLHGMERKFDRDSRFQQLYQDFLQQYEELGHMSPLDSALPTINPVAYLPHHGVLREASVSTKLRVVFNGSTKTPAGDSLNNQLRVGPCLLPALSDVLLRWRTHRFVLATDVEKMYRQILVHEEDRDLQRIIWRKSSKGNCVDYQLNTVTYGLACAPFLAMRTLQQLAIDEKERFPRGAAVLRDGVYMDDILTGAETLKETKDLQQQLIGLCTAGGFPLRKWSANDPALLEDIPAEHRLLRDLREWQPLETHTMLGLRWHPASDEFSFVTSTFNEENLTKRSVLSFMAKLFDPLGWLAPATVTAKITFQKTWLQGLEWDAPLDDASAKNWRNFLKEFSHLENIRVPRWVGSPLNANTEIHGFSDASERAYAAVLYLRSKYQDSWQTTLLTAKTKVAPIKQISLPRLELCAAALLVRLAKHARTTLKLEKSTLHCWTDSTVTLGWIRGHASKWKTFVANRVSEIQTSAPDAKWHHIPGKENPADCASRGMLPADLVHLDLWWQGPSWLATNSSSWSTNPDSINEENLPEVRVKNNAVNSASSSRTEPEELVRFSALSRLQRVTAWCRRWLRFRKKEEHSAKESPFPSGSLTPEELDAALSLWIRQVQAEQFKTELESIRKGGSLAKSSELIRLSPFLDPQGILRVGGRLKHSVLAFDERHPIILPSYSHLSLLVIESCHRRTLHGGTQLTLALIRQRFWLPRGRVLVKGYIQRCVRCVRWRAASPHQLMGDLPPERVTPARPFLNSGVDYAGPIKLRTTKGRGHRAYKAFIAVFVCLSTKAVHIEVVSDYTAEAFLAAFKRFVSRRGICRTIWSDCGTNFVGADAQLRALFATSSAERRRITEQLTTERVQWRFNPPSAPHFGGIWEAAVKSVKHHLRRVIGEASLTFEEMSTLLAQIEACLNSRPLQALTDDPEDLTALTPGHFLVGTPLTAVPEPSLLDQSSNRLSRWQLMQQMRDHFWERWSQEYLHSLTQRSKWQTRESGFEVGRLCLIRQENLPPTRWLLARIVRTHPGKDGQVRVVTVRTAASELTRPVVKLVLLPVSDSEDTTQRGSTA